MKVYEIGYRRDGDHIEALMQEDLSLLLIDTRKVPFTKIEIFAQFNKPALLATYGKRYHPAGDFLGNVNYKDHNKPIVIAQPVRGIQGLVRYLNEGHNIILMCGCAGYATCHRKVIVDLLKEKMPEIDLVLSYRIRGIA